MINIFNDKNLSDNTDSELILTIQQGNRGALQELIGRHQDWIFNIALRMAGCPHDAEDVTQEILIKMITKLSTFKGNSSFRTWLYRITANQVLNMKKQPRELFFSSFQRHGEIAGTMVDSEFPDTMGVSAEAKLLIKETKMGCMTGMLLCLDRSQRLVFIMGAVLGIESDLGGKILEISADNFRQKLSRSRKHLSQFMNEKCGLMNPDNQCSCARKTRAAIQAGYVDPKHLQFHKYHVEKIRSIVATNTYSITSFLELRVQNLFQEHPFLVSPDSTQLLENCLGRGDIQCLVDF